MAIAVRLWRIGADTPDYEAHDLSGKGAQTTGGRWNRKGRRVVDTSTTIALAWLEKAAHLNTGGLPMNRYLVCIDVPPDVWKMRRTLAGVAVPVGRDAVPQGKASLDLGDAWLDALVEPLLLVPSVVVPIEINVLINPAHSLATKLSATKICKWRYDQRLEA